MSLRAKQPKISKHARKRANRRLRQNPDVTLHRLFEEWPKRGWKQRLHRVLLSACDTAGTASANDLLRQLVLRAGQTLAHDQTGVEFFADLYAEASQLGVHVPRMIRLRADGARPRRSPVLAYRAYQMEQSAGKRTPRPCGMGRLAPRPRRDRERAQGVLR